MADLPQYRIQTPTPQTPGVSPVLQSNPFESLASGIQSGASLGLQARQVAALEQERQTQLMAAQYAAKAAQEKQLIDYMGVAHETYKDLADVNPEHAFQFYKTSIAPLHQAFLQSKGINADFSNINPNEETPPIIEKMNELMQKAADDPSKIPSTVVTLQQMANMPSVGKIYKQRLEDSMKALGGVTEAAKHQSELFQNAKNEFDKQLSNRSGGLGLQDAKVNQAAHLRTMINQNSKVDPNTGQATYDFPQNIQGELVLGLANLVSGNNMTNVEQMQSLTPKTFRGDLSKVASYWTGTPFSATPQNFAKQLVEQIDRQGETSQQLRDTYQSQFHSSVDPALNPDYRKELQNTTRGIRFEDYQKRKLENKQQPGNIIQIMDSTGKVHSIYKQNLESAKKRDPGLRVIK